MSKTKIFLYISDIASFIGQNKWDYVTPFERLWKRCDPTGYQTCIEHYNSKINVQHASLIGIDHELLQLKSDLDEKRLSKRQYTIKAKQLEGAKEEIKSVIGAMQNKIDDINLTQQEKLERTIGKETINDIQDATIQTSKKRSTVKSIVEGLNVSDDKREDIRKQAESFINKSHGTIQESDAIHLFEAKYKVKLDISQTFFKKRLDDASKSSVFDWYICGKMDGIFEDPQNPLNNYVVEVKNRTKGFFTSLRDYEKTQVQMYLWMTAFNKAHLVEKYESRLRITQVQRDNSYINDTLEYLDIFVKNFESHFLDCQQSKLDYIVKNNDDKKCFLKRLFIEDILKRMNAKIEKQIAEDQDCMIDDLDSI